MGQRQPFGKHRAATPEFQRQSVLGGVETAIFAPWRESLEARERVTKRAFYSGEQAGLLGLLLPTSPGIESPAVIHLSGWCDSCNLRDGL
jgi:hypothetical protein